MKALRSRKNPTKKQPEVDFLFVIGISESDGWALKESQLPIDGRPAASWV